MRALNRAFQILPSAARTAVSTSAQLSNADARGLLLTVDVTAFTAASLIVLLEVKNEAGLWHIVYQDGTGILGTGTYAFLFYPGAANGNMHAVVPIPVPLEARLRIFRNGGSTHTLSVRGQWLI